jgi:hypothetical protein
LFFVFQGVELKSPLPENKKIFDENEEETPSKQDKLTNISGNSNKNAFSANFERSSSVRSDGAVDSMSKDVILHQRINSEPLPQSQRRKSSDDNKGDVKLEAYQKWRLCGRKGQPPAKLKISQ